MTTPTPGVPPPQFPTHTQPRVWLITSCASPVGLALARAVLAHGDLVVAGVRPAEVEKGCPRAEELRGFWDEVLKGEEKGSLGKKVKERVRVVGLDGRCVIRSSCCPPPSPPQQVDAMREEADICP